MSNPLQDSLIELARIKEQIEDLSEEKREVEEVIVASLKATGQKSVSANGGDLKGTLVEGSVITIDDEGLKKRLTAAQWKKVTKQVLDKERLEAEITVGNIDANEVAAVSTEKDRKPYIRVSGTFRPKKNKAPSPKAAVNTKNSSGGTKPAAKKRVVKPKASPPNGAHRSTRKP